MIAESAAPPHYLIQTRRLCKWVVREYNVPRVTCRTDSRDAQSRTSRTKMRPSTRAFRKARTWPTRTSRRFSTAFGNRREILHSRKSTVESSVWLTVCRIARYRLEEPSETPLPFAYVDDLLVLAKYRGQGIGKALLAEAGMPSCPAAMRRSLNPPSRQRRKPSGSRFLLRCRVPWNTNSNSKSGCDFHSRTDKKCCARRIAE